MRRPNAVKPELGGPLGSLKNPLDRNLRKFLSKA
jgi:hypothetical protein